MRKIILTATAFAAFAVASPASAQPRGYPGDRPIVARFHGDLEQLRFRIERSAERRAISPGEYQSMMRQVGDLNRRIDDFARDGLSRGEIRDLNIRIQGLSDRIRRERHDGPRRW